MDTTSTSRLAAGPVTPTPPDTYSASALQFGANSYPTLTPNAVSSSALTSARSSKALTRVCPTLTLAETSPTSAVDGEVRQARQRAAAVSTSVFARRMST